MVSVGCSRRYSSRSISSQPRTRLTSSTSTTKLFQEPVVSNNEPRDLLAHLVNVPVDVGPCYIIGPLSKSCSRTRATVAITTMAPPIRATSSDSVSYLLVSPQKIRQTIHQSHHQQRRLAHDISTQWPSSSFYGYKPNLHLRGLGLRHARGPQAATPLHNLTDRLRQQTMTGQPELYSQRPPAVSGACGGVPYRSRRHFPFSKTISPATSTTTRTASSSAWAQRQRTEVEAPAQPYPPPKATLPAVGSMRCSARRPARPVPQ